MFKYKREKNNYDRAKQIEYNITDNSKICFCIGGTLKASKPYQGIYIKDSKVLLENLVETFNINGKAIKIIELDTKTKEFSTQEYLDSADLEENLFEYSFNDIKYTKRFAFDEKSETLCVEYYIENNNRSDIDFKVIPLITYRDYFNMKNSSMLNFNQREVDNGVLVALSVSDQENLIVKSIGMNWNSEENILSDVKHELITKNYKKEVYFEDLVINGNFSAQIKGFSKQKFYVFISYKDINLNEINLDEVYKNIDKRNKDITFGVNENFVELIDLSKSILNTHNNSLISVLPFKREFNQEYLDNINKLSVAQITDDLDELIDITRSVEGQYLYYKEIDEAKHVVLTVLKIIKKYDTIDLNEEARYKLNLLKLWYIESVNRILQKEGRIELYIDSIKEILYDFVTPEHRVSYFKTIEITALMLNAVKIYLNILTWIGDTDKQMEIQEEYFTKLIENEFWIKEKNIMKKDLRDDKHYACVEMLYTLSLSFPCVNGQIPNKLLDTVFKELYTPYGLREMSKTNPKYNGLIYPKYMAHFIKANLRLTGITRASQKISFNLVKELLQDVGKYVNGGVKKIYSEQGIAINSMGYDLLTNAEMVRLYHMFM